MAEWAARLSEGDEWMKTDVRSLSDLELEAVCGGYIDCTSPTTFISTETKDGDMQSGRPQTLVFKVGRFALASR
jgi:hypothetical protein